MHSRRTLRSLTLVVVAGAALGAPPAVRAQAVSGAHAVDACAMVTAAELEQALGAKFKNQKPTVAARPGVSTCMWISAAARAGMSLSVTTYSPEAIKGTNQRSLRDYYESLKTNSTRASGKRAEVFPHIAKHVSYFPRVSPTSDAILVLREDCVVSMGVAGLNREQAVKVAEAAGN